MSFDQLGLIEPIMKALKGLDYHTPTPIQVQAIPTVLQRRDLLGCAQTGTGKTAAFAVPILQILTADKPRAHNAVRALIVTPTRELAIQIDESFADYGKHLNLRHAVIFGGVSQGSQVSALKRGVDILIATPGRLLDLVNQGFLHLGNIEIFVLDEADRMLDMGFIHDVRRILKVIPEKRLSLFFSATMPPDIVQLADKILQNPAKVEVTPVSSTAETIEQRIFFVDKDSKRELLIHLLEDSSIPTALVFTRTKHGADKVVKMLVKEGIKAMAIHGNKSQNARQAALSDFKARKIRVLVATDIAARGIDVEDLTHVINFELPNIPETYVHRIGRTGRAGADGIAFSFCDSEEKAYLKDIHKLIGLTIPVVHDHPYPLINHDPAPQPARVQEQRPQQRNNNNNNNGQQRQRNDSSSTGNGARKSNRNWRGGGGGSSSTKPNAPTSSNNFR